MPRPHGSKNKPKTTTSEEPIEFDYEKFGSDEIYNQIMNTEQSFTTTVNPTVREVPIVATVTAPETTTFYNNPELIMSDKAQLLYLIEGRVRMDQMGSNEPVFSDQRRLVWAYSFEEAAGKFSNYFAGISTTSQRYTVIGAGGSESIS
jgi:hypothetical protein